MWLLTDFGFFSIVKKAGEDELTVRSRVKSDLEMLKKRYIPDMGNILEHAGSDYRFRALVSKQALAEAMKHIVLNIDYDNFKKSVAKKQGSKRAAIYGDVWSTLWALDEDKGGK